MSNIVASAALAERARVIIVRDGAIALIERRRAGRRYYVLPGGGVEPGETPEIAAAREAREELGVTVAVGREVASFLREGTVQHVFLAVPTGGRFGSGTGPEMRGERAGRGSYRAVWLPLDRLSRVELRPHPVAAFIAAVRANGWAWPGEAARLRG